MAPPPPVLMEELVEEILLRFAPSDPSLLVRAALVCRKWCRLVSARGFRRRFRERHRGRAPMLGFLCNLWDDAGAGGYLARFVPASRALPPLADRHSFALDARHGRVLLYSSRAPSQDGDGQAPPDTLDYEFVIWDPAADAQRFLPPVRWVRMGAGTWSAAVLCAAADCDHADCLGGHFLVVFVSIVAEEVHVHVYSSEAAAWSTTVVGYLGPVSRCYIAMGPGLLAGGALHFALEDGRRILRYDPRSHGLVSLGETPMAAHPVMGNMGLVTAEGGGVGVAGIMDSKLCLWSRAVGPDGVPCWDKVRAIELDAMGIRARSHVVGFAEGADTVFVCGDGIFAVDLKSGEVRKVRENGHFFGVVPFVSFYTPDQAKGLPPTAASIPIPLVKN